MKTVIAREADGSRWIPFDETNEEYLHAENRIGKIPVEFPFFFHHEVRLLFSQIRVFHIDFDQPSNTLMLYAYSAHFRPCPPQVEPPIYNFVLHRDEQGIDWMDFTESIPVSVSDIQL